MPALALPSFFQSNSLRSVFVFNAAISMEKFPRDVRNALRAEVSASVDVVTLREIQLAITSVFGNIDVTNNALSSLFTATS
ncbi:hypothetical protein DL96DRAFT_1717625 [Flagelloscypha sp. PMI_526]|nr:hypothetical protein DL96DRAFT_1717625 [Flagelloscypha sp. PMI_526]